MVKSQTLGVDATVLIVFCVLGIALASIFFSIYSSFRLPENFTQLAWQLNFDRTVVVFSAGFALVVSFASNSFQNTVEKQVGAYAFLVLSASGFAFGQAFSWPLIPSAVLALALGISAFYVSMKLRVTSPASNLVLGISLYILFFISVAAYFAADLLTGDSGSLILWLLSDVSRIGVNGYYAAFAVLLASLWLFFADKQDVPAILLLGLSIGLLGPIVFLGWLLPTLVKRLLLGEKAYLLVSGLIGGAILVLISTVNSLAFGGYAPALIIPLGFIGIPSILWLSRLPKKGSLISLLEIALILVSFVFSVIVVWHLADFAARLA